MIEKITNQNQIARHILAKKINELVDAVNEILDYAPLEMAQKAEPDGDDAIQEVIHADPFAEQKKWIGKLCMFWDNDDTQQLSYGVLTKIDTESRFGVQYCCNDEYDYDNCQPVNPDDDIIYKGE